MDLEIIEADDGQWAEYDALTRRAYGQPVSDVVRLAPYADRRVVVRGGQVVAGGMGLLVPQWFGGRPVPAASMGCGCVAPEERGGRLAARLVEDRVRVLQDKGAVLATLWTAANGYVRRLGWEAPAQVFSWTVPTAALKRPDADTLDIAHGDTAQLAELRDRLSAQWNGPWQRPAWWTTWQHDVHPALETYAFSDHGRNPTGALAVAIERTPGGRQLVVQDLWAADAAAANAMLAFLGRHHARIPIVTFERTGLPPGLLLPSHLAGIGAMTATSWHPWMLRVLDLTRAVQLRGWPKEADLDLPVAVVTEDRRAADRYSLCVAGGEGELKTTGREPQLTLTKGQFAVWYAGGYRSAAAALQAGVQGDPQALTRLLSATADREPWLADHF
ncbi:enhanced intracellular survival protein Eis [Streptomyces sp. NPDC057910]|uniref:GNAT family N-acetyltransferase n=1 Tax=Streptomyces sp. NPDC057910 TaxID=3346278 RepID=UPI0036E3526B